MAQTTIGGLKMLKTTRLQEVEMIIAYLKSELKDMDMRDSRIDAKRYKEHSMLLNQYRMQRNYLETVEEEEEDE